MSVILFLIILAVLIVSHEFGHFWAAKRAGIRVDEFAIGFPPKLLSWTRGETKYSLNLLPFGGFVKIFGEDPNEETVSGPDSARSFTSKSRWIQAWVVVAGVVFNALLAWILFSLSFVMGVQSSVEGAPRGVTLENVALTVTSVLPKTPAERAGLMPGDRIVALGTETEKPAAVDAASAEQFIAAHKGQKIAFVYERGKKTESVVVTPEEGVVAGKAAIGVGLDMVGTAKLPIHRAFIEGASISVSSVVATAKGIYGLIAQAVAGEGSLAALTGPVGIVGLVGTASTFGFSYLISFVALISINLAVLNLLPLPALDGGRLLFIGIEGVTRRPIPHKIMNGMNAAGFVLLIGLMLAVTYHDIVKLVAQ